MVSGLGSLRSSQSRGLYRTWHVGTPNFSRRVGGGACSTLHSGDPHLSQGVCATSGSKRSRSQMGHLLYLSTTSKKEISLGPPGQTSWGISAGVPGTGCLCHHFSCIILICRTAGSGDTTEFGAPLCRVPSPSVASTRFCRERIKTAQHVGLSPPPLGLVPIAKS